MLAYFDHRASNGPTEAINGRLEALRRNALGFRNLINYRIRSLLHCGAPRTLNPEEPYNPGIGALLRLRCIHLDDGSRAKNIVYATLVSCAGDLRDIFR